MTLSSEGFEFLKKREGFDRVARWDGKAWTIGHGNTYYENGTKVKQGDTITTERAKTLFKNIATDFSKKVNAKLTVSVSQALFDMLVSYAYNRGIGTFYNSEVLRAVNARKSENEIAVLFVKYWGTNERYKTALINRRKLEVAYFLGSSTPNSDNTIFYGILAAVGVYLVNKKVEFV